MEGILHVVLGQEVLALACDHAADCAEFLHNLIKKGDLKVRMIKGYKSAIVATLKARGMNVGTEPHICGIISSFYTDRPVEINW